jgi:orotate phosphoribosyltransferase
VNSYKIAFVDFMLGAGVLRFGDFVTKSGRNTPYFVNAGLYRTGAQMARLAGFYADAIHDRGIEFDCLFGPAYKGIPLCVAVAMELSRRDHDVPFCFNRKEAKDHGEGGALVGHTPRAGERILIVEDVTTAGTSIRETVPLLRATADVKLAALVVSVDRMERGKGELSALAELREEFGLDAFSIVTIEEVMAAIDGHELEHPVALDPDWRRRYAEYRERWGGVG